MDDNLFALIALVVTLIVSGAGAVIIKQGRSLLKNLSELLIAAEKCIEDDCTVDELKNVIKEAKESLEDGLGIQKAILSVFKR